MQQAWDSALVRHIYDVHCVYFHQPDIIASALEIFPKLVAGDQQAFGGQFPDFKNAAWSVLAGALRQANEDKSIRAEYANNLMPLIYGNEAPTFAKAYGSFNTVASSLLTGLQD
jgi:hypothetical protein